MEYGTLIGAPAVTASAERGTAVGGTDGYMSMLVGWDHTRDASELANQIFCPANVTRVSKRITETLRGVREADIVVPDKTIRDVLSSFFEQGTRTALGDVYTKDHTDLTQNYFNDVVSQTITVISNQIRNEFEVQDINRKLNRWDATVLGEGNKLGLRQHAPLKIREKHPAMGQFMMNY